MRLEFGLAILVGAKVDEESLDSLAECFVLCILIKLICKEFDLVKNTVGVVSIPVTEKILSFVVQRIPLVSRLVFEDISLL